MDSKMIIFGCGRLGHEAVITLGNENIECFCDNNPELHGSERCGKKIISFNELKDKYNDSIIIICADLRKRHAFSIAKQCEEGGIFDYLFYEPLKDKSFFLNQKELLEFLNNPINRLRMKNEIYLNKTIELQRQVDYFKEHADIMHIKPAEGALRERQLEIIKVSAEVLEKLEKLDIKPFLDGGSLLGYVRHNGFIPWDDDIDFALIRDDYERLKEYCRGHMYSENEFYSEKRSDKKVDSGLENFFWSHNGGDEFNIYKPYRDGDKIAVDFFPMEYYSEDYSFDELIRFAGKVRERLNSVMFDNEQRIACFQDALMENRHNIAKESSNIYFGIDNMEIMNKVHKGQWIARETIFPLKKVLYEGEYFWVPNNPEEYLKYEFDNIWEFPDDVGISPHEYRYKVE